MPSTSEPYAPQPVSPAMPHYREHEPRQPKLEVKGIGKTFRTVVALQDIHLQVYPGEFVGIVGASGCGKSTLLNIIAGLLAPTMGEVLVDGDPVRGPGCDRGMIFQNYSLFPWLTVADNVGFGLDLQGISGAERRERIGYYLNVVGLTQFASAYPKQLSGGMKQRVAIARSLATQPEVLLMDEPFGALDAQTREQMQAFLLDLWQQTHTTILAITHDVEEAVFLSQRIYVMQPHPGRIQTEILVNLPALRPLDTKLAPEFIEIKRQVIHCLRGA